MVDLQADTEALRAVLRVYGSAHDRAAFERIAALSSVQKAERLLVWWTSQAECSAIDEVSRLALPLYLQREVASRAGRAGHGRLWVPSEIDQLAAEPIRVIDGWQTPLGLHIEEFCAGIVFSSKDLASLARLPGTVTDLELRKVGFDG
jgi:hypothetical protein